MADTPVSVSCGSPKVTIEAGLYYISHNLRKLHAFLAKKEKKTQLIWKTEDHQIQPFQFLKHRLTRNLHNLVL